MNVLVILNTNFGTKRVARGTIHIPFQMLDIPQFGSYIILRSHPRATAYAGFFKGGGGVFESKFLDAAPGLKKSLSGVGGGGGVEPPPPPAYAPALT